MGAACAKREGKYFTSVEYDVTIKNINGIQNLTTALGQNVVLNFLSHLEQLLESNKTEPL